MKAWNAPGEVCHSQAMKNATRAPARPTSSGVWRGQARTAAAMNAAANIARPASGAGGERNSQWSSSACHAVPDRLLRPALAIQATAMISATATMGQR